VERVELDTFQVAYDIIGGGEEGSKYEIATKEEADHSLPYLLAVALLDGQVLPEQYRPERIAAPDVQALLRRVEVRPDDELSQRFPDEHSARIRVHMRDGRVLEREQHDYEGFHTRPMSWEAVEAKFDRLASPHADDRLRARIKDAAARLDSHCIPDREAVGMTEEALTIQGLEDWARAGAHWRVVHHGERRGVVELQQCTGEPIERLESEDPAVIAYLRGVESDLDLY
jgi:hypothetical protein